MRISHKHKFIFLSTPRTGSTSVRSVLDKYSDIKSTHISNVTDDFPYYHHISASELKNIFDNKCWQWNSYKRFCVIRNPYDRVVSLYHHHLWQRNILNQKGIRGFIRNVLFRKFSAPTFKDYVSTLHPKKRLQTSLLNFICDASGHYLVQDILMFENLNSELSSYITRLGLDVLPNEIPHLNISSDRNNYRDYYDDQTQKKVYEIYKYEIDRFGYTL